MKYIKKPIVIEAEQFLANKQSFDAIMEMGDIKWEPGPMGSESFYIETSSGKVKVVKTDYVIKGIDDSFYPCKEDVFNKTYDQFNDES